MDVREKDEVKGMLLERWIEDLREDRAPKSLPEMQLLTPEEIGEVLLLARWYKASLYPTEPRIDVDDLAASLRAAVMQDRAASQSVAADLVETTPTFGALVKGIR